MVKIYYNNTSKIICNRYPSNVPVDDNCSYIEVEDKIFEETLLVDYGKIWKVIDNVPICVEDETITSTTNYQIEIRNNEIIELKRFLSETDYIITKIQEAQIEDENEANQLKQKYSDELKKRVAFRQRINELENEIIQLKKE